jgi:FkbM family methyltransferase
MSGYTRTRARLYALQMGWLMWRHLRNWPAVWSAYRRGCVLPTLVFRDGLRLHHGARDDVWASLLEVWFSRAYLHSYRPEPGNVVIDIGANIGLLPLQLSRSDPPPTVHCFEPSPATFARLQQNIAANGLSHVHPHLAAVAGKSGKVTVHLNRLSVADSLYVPSATDEKVEARAYSLDDALALVGLTNLPLALLKVDAEGAEAEILEAAAATTLARVQNVALEYHDHLCPRALERCRGVLERAGLICTLGPHASHQGLLFGERRGTRLVRTPPRDDS